MNLNTVTEETAGLDTRDENKSSETVPALIFRAYDIRGIFNESLTENTVRLVGQALGAKPWSVVRTR